MRIKALDEMCKGKMIRAIQLAEGSRDCFGNIRHFDCLEIDCCWREDCRTVKPG